MTTAGAFVGVLFMAGLVEFLVEQAFGQWLSGWKMKLIAMAVGLAAALVFKIGMIAGLDISGLDMTSTAATWADYVLTGLLIGAGSTKVHEFFDKYLPAKTQ